MAALLRHPSDRSPSDITIDATAKLVGDGHISARFTVIGNLGNVDIPDLSTNPNRKDELWRHTCFEVFIRQPDQKSYIEYNLSPTRDWAAYEFQDYRKGMKDAAVDERPTMRTLASSDQFVLDALFNFSPPKGSAISSTLHIGLSAILAGVDGAVSHWALAHPPGKPDFHHSDCFALQIQAENPA